MLEQDQIATNSKKKNKNVLRNAGCRKDDSGERTFLYNFQKPEGRRLAGGHPKRKEIREGVGSVEKRESFIKKLEYIKIV